MEPNLVANTVYIFILLSFCTGILGGVSFAIREFITSKINGCSAKPKRKTTERIKQILTKTSTPTGELPYFWQKSSSKATSPPQSSTHSPLSDLTKLSLGTLVTQRPDPRSETAQYSEFIELQETPEPETKDSPQYVSREERLPPQISCVSNNPQSTPLAEKIVYRNEEMLRLQNQENTMKPQDEVGKKKVRMTDLLKFHHVLPEVKAADYDGLLSLCIETRQMMRFGDDTERSLGEMKLACLGNSLRLYGNFYFFVGCFIDVVEVASEIVLTAPRDKNRTNLVDLAVTFCWHHSQAESNEEILRMVKCAQRFVDTRKPIQDSCGLECEDVACCVEVLPLCRVLQILLAVCVYCGDLTTFCYEGCGLAAEMAIKAACVTKDILQRTTCGDHEEVIILLSNAIGNSHTSLVQCFLYEMVYGLVSGHQHCCLLEKEMEKSASELGALVRHGVWILQDKKVKEKARKILKLLQKDEDMCVAPGGW